MSRLRPEWLSNMSHTAQRVSGGKGLLDQLPYPKMVYKSLRLSCLSCRKLQCPLPWGKCPCQPVRGQERERAEAGQALLREGGEGSCCAYEFSASVGRPPQPEPADLPSSLLNNSIWEEPGIRRTVLMGL